MTSSRGPFLTLNAGGVLSGSVTIIALPERGQLAAGHEPTS
jgi:hypothetical protein